MSKLKEMFEVRYGMEPYLSAVASLLLSGLLPKILCCLLVYKSGLKITLPNAYKCGSFYMGSLVMVSS